MPVDFDGSESSFLGTTLSGFVDFPASGGPATVSTTWTITMTGPAASADWTGGHTDVDLGPAFSSSAADIVTGIDTAYVATTSNWSSAVVPELNGALVTMSATQTSRASIS